MDVRDADDAHYSDPRFDGIAYQIYDYSGAITKSITLNEAIIVAAHDNVAERYKKKFKVAFIAVDSHTCELIDKYVSYLKSKGSNWEFKTFLNQYDAIEWCECGIRQKGPL